MILSILTGSIFEGKKVMKYDFTTRLARGGWDPFPADMVENDLWEIPKGTTLPGFDQIPMWIADMNFAAADSIIEAIQRRAALPSFGYFIPSEDYYSAIVRWQREGNGVTDLTREHIGYENGVLGGITSAMRVLCSDGDVVLLHSPTYNGFTSQLERNGYKIILSPLKLDKDNVWRMDFADMEQKLRQYRIHTALLCSPHNPTGRVWERWELEQAMELYRKYDVYVISDEIWSDLTLFGHSHIPTQSISEDARNRTAAFYAPTKTFNLAGLVGSYHIIYNRYLRDRITRYEALSHYNDMNVLSMHALVGAYQPEGRVWLNELKTVLEQNIRFAYDFIQEHFEGVHLSMPQGTYMILIDCAEWCRRHGKTIEDLQQAGIQVGVIWREGSMYHVPYGIRINLALPHKKVAEAFSRLKQYVF